MACAASLPSRKLWQARLAPFAKSEQTVHPKNNTIDTSDDGPPERRGDRDMHQHAFLDDSLLFLLEAFVGHSRRSSVRGTVNTPLHRSLDNYFRRLMMDLSVVLS
jgi:hypothetical protein